MSRGKTEAEDQRLAKQLVNDPKSAPNTRCSLTFTATTSAARRLRHRPGEAAYGGEEVQPRQHLSSEITALLAPEHDMFTALALVSGRNALGCAEIESMKIIDANEKTGRGPYGGAVEFLRF